MTKVSYFTLLVIKRKGEMKNLADTIAVPEINSIFLCKINHVTVFSY